MTRGATESGYVKKQMGRQNHVWKCTGVPEDGNYQLKGREILKCRFYRARDQKNQKLIPWTGEHQRDKGWEALRSSKPIEVGSTTSLCSYCEYFPRSKGPLAFTVPMEYKDLNPSGVPGMSEVDRLWMCAYQARDSLVLLAFWLTQYKDISEGRERVWPLDINTWFKMKNVEGIPRIWWETRCLLVLPRA